MEDAQKPPAREKLDLAAQLEALTTKALRLERTVRDLTNQNTNLLQLNEAQQLKLKICRNYMRGANIGDKYPGANPDIENDWKTNPDEMNGPERFAVLQQALLAAQHDAGRWKSDADSLTDLVEELVVKVQQYEPEFKPREIVRSVNLMQIIGMRENGGEIKTQGS